MHIYIYVVTLYIFLTNDRWKEPAKTLMRAAFCFCCRSSKKHIFSCFSRRRRAEKRERKRAFCARVWVEYREKNTNSSKQLNSFFSNYIKDRFLSNFFMNKKKQKTHNQLQIHFVDAKMRSLCFVAIFAILSLSCK